MVMAQATQATISSIQSRVGKRPLPLPKGVDVSVVKGCVVVKGPKGSLERALPPLVSVKSSDGNVYVIPKPDAGRDGKRLQGLLRALVLGMVEGVSKGFETTLVLHGVGYRASLKGQELTMALGFSHPVNYLLPAGIGAEVDTIEESGVKRMRIKLRSHDKELLGQTAARLRRYRPPEPYKGKGIRYLGEKVREKAGKAAGVGKTA
jgi:large subunit ribosomal protein L6